MNKRQLELINKIENISKGRSNISKEELIKDLVYNSIFLFIGVVMSIFILINELLMYENTFQSFILVALLILFPIMSIKTTSDFLENKYLNKSNLKLNSFDLFFDNIINTIIGLVVCLVFPLLSILFFFIIFELDKDTKMFYANIIFNIEIGIIYSYIALKNTKVFMKNFSKYVENTSRKKELKKENEILLNMLEKEFDTMAKLNYLIKYSQLKFHHNTMELGKELRYKKVEELGFTSFSNYELAFYKIKMEEELEMQEKLEIENN